MARTWNRPRRGVSFTKRRAREAAGARRECRVAPRRAALVSALLGGAAILWLARPTPAQQSVPALSFSAPAAVAPRRSARVTMSFTLPPGLQLYDHPRVRVLDTNGRLVELLPATITQLSPVGAAFRDLHSENYPAGIYQVSVELEFQAPGAAIRTVSTPPRPLTIQG